MRKGIVIAVIVTWVVVSFVPAIQLTSIMGKGKGKGKG
jgi:hypothetical protein